MFEAVLCEFEGILVDTGPVRRAALLRSLRDDGIRLTEEQYADACAGFPVHEAAQAALALSGATHDPTALDLIALRAERYFAEAVGKGVSLAPGAPEFVADAGGRTRLGIVTRASRREVEFVLGLAGWEAAFEVIVTRDDVHTPKPSAETYEVALDRLARRRSVRPTHLLAMEDGPAGILAAHRVKIACVAVGEVPAHHAVDAEAYVPSLEGQTLETLYEMIVRGKERVR